MSGHRGAATWVSGWGGIGMAADERRSEDLDAITRDVPLTRGLGRSYGHASLPAAGRPLVAATPLGDRLLAFDPRTGVLRAEAGYSLRELYRTFLPRGWFTPVSPGTQFVTLGGMVAADVHGKNHHQDGTVGRHVQAIRLRTAQGPIVEASRTREPDLFRATLGGMGLTGHILEVELRLTPVPSPWVMGEDQRVPGIDAFITALKTASAGWPFTMGWIDCLSRGRTMGRGVLLSGRWATADEAPAKMPPRRRGLTVPVVCPSWLMGRAVGRTFNEVYYRIHGARPRMRLFHPERFFYPLDAIAHWNRLYGRRGFTQYQCVLPDETARDAAPALLERLTRRGDASFLCVIKDCGAEGEGLLSFPRPGISMALDLPIRSDTPQLVAMLNELVIAAGGRIYLAKDAFTRAEHFQAMEPRLAAWQAIRRRWDPEGRLRSALSVRLLGDRP